MSEVEKERFLRSGELITIAAASEGTPYSAEYLSLLARKGRLKAVKLGRDWVTTRVAVSMYVQRQRIKHQKMLTMLGGEGGDL